MPAPAATTRRDFLRGHPVARAVGGFLQSGVAGVESSSPQRFISQTPQCRWGLEDSTPATQSSSLITVSRRAMACQFEVVLPAITKSATEAAFAALDEIDRLEDQMTVYRETSEVSRINLLAAVRPVPVEERLFALLETALRLTDETDGAFDMAAGALVKSWGFFRGPKRVPGSEELTRVADCVGSRHIVLDRERRTVEFRRAGLELNLGAVGKGYALDRAAELLRRDWNVRSAILHGGQSSVVAIGSPSGGHGGLEESPAVVPKRILSSTDTDTDSFSRKPQACATVDNTLLSDERARLRLAVKRQNVNPTCVQSKNNESDRDGWLIGIAHPSRAGEQIATVRLRDAALGTSGSTMQYFEANGRRFGHILDPRTGWPAEGQACVSVIAPTAAEADALSTAFYILGPDKTRDYCERRPEIGAIVVSNHNLTEEPSVQVLGSARDIVTVRMTND